MGKHRKSHVPPRAAAVIGGMAGAAVLAVAAAELLPGGAVAQPDALRHLPPTQEVATGIPPVWRHPVTRYIPPPVVHHKPKPVFTQTPAQKAVSYAYQQLGCPYVWGGNGPCDQGFDCSGLMQQAWASAGVSIPRTTWDQLSGLPHVAESEMRPGDLLIVHGGGHVGMYVGNGWVIDAPHQGANVEKVSRDDFVNWNGLVAVLRP